MNSTTRIAFSVLGAAGLGLSALATAPVQAAGPAERGPNDLCKVRVLSVQALDVQEDNQGDDHQGEDEVFLRLGDVNTVQRTYEPGNKRNTLGDGSDFFNGRERVALIENDEATGNKDVIDRRRLACDAGQFETVLSDANADTVYTVVWRIDEIS